MLHPAAVLNEPLTLPNGTRLPNRIAKAAMSECLGDVGLSPTARHTQLYRRWSGGGAGLLITGNIMIDRSAIGEVGNVVVDDRRDLAILAAWAAAARSDGAHVWAQINHPGKQIPLTLNSRPVAPSPIPITGPTALFRRPRELTHNEILEIIDKFGHSAEILIEAGFTGIEIHAAHGYLINQFLSPLSNTRTDHWGGSAEKRHRFLLEVVRAVRARIGPQIPLAVKLNSADFQRGGFGENESAQVVRALACEGIDLLEISGGTYELGTPTQSLKASTASREAYFLDFAERIRTLTSVPILLTGGFRTAAAMAEAISSGAIDVVGLARPLVLDPLLPSRLLNGYAGVSTIEPRRIGISFLDGATELTWHTTQLWRLAEGKTLDSNAHPARTLITYFSRLFPYLLHRLTTAATESNMWSRRTSNASR